MPLELVRAVNDARIAAVIALGFLAADTVMIVIIILRLGFTGL